MSKIQKISLLALRLVLGWMFFYAGVTKILDPSWSAAGYLKSAATFGGFYSWLAGPSLLPLTNFVNAWGLTLLGVALILGVFVRLSAAGGMLIMLLYYLPILKFPYPNPHSYIVDEHIIYIAALLVLAAFRAGDAWGLASRFPRLRGWLG
jgi:thiosulfate dehydrogenase [quinone] large subunit